MIIALLALAVAMILGGLLTTFFGWDIVLVERGWTMVIAGSVIAASGAILLGIAAAVSKLSRIQTLLSEIQESSEQEAIAAASPSLAGLSLAAASGGVIAAAAVAEAEETEAKDEAQPVLPLFGDEDRSERDGSTVQAAEWPEPPRLDEPVLPFPPRTTPAPAPLRDEDETDMKVPDFLLAERGRDVDEEPRVTDGADIYNRDLEEAREPEADERDERADRGETLADAESEHELETASEIAPAPVQPDLEEEPEEEIAPDASEPATVVGTYNSGDNKYVMFSDGSIEAQTPSGVFRFKSLDELKEFIAAGGEGNSSI
jgi:hypothetical protein